MPLNRLQFFAQTISRMVIRAINFLQSCHRSPGTPWSRAPALTTGAITERWNPVQSDPPEESTFLLSGMPKAEQFLLVTYIKDIEY